MSNLTSHAKSTGWGHALECYLIGTVMRSEQWTDKVLSQRWFLWLQNSWKNPVWCGGTKKGLKWMIDILFWLLTTRSVNKHSDVSCMLVNTCHRACSHAPSVVPDPESLWESVRVHIVPSHTTLQNSVFEGLGVITALRQSLISEVF